MKNKRPILLPKYERALKQVGEQFKLARLRRKLSYGASIGTGQYR
nr:hypothetical protein [Gracilimonas sp.]